MSRFFQTCGSPIRALHLAQRDVHEEPWNELSPPSTWERGNYTALCALKDTKQFGNAKAVELKQINLSKLEFAVDDADQDDENDEECDEYGGHFRKNHDGGIPALVGRVNRIELVQDEDELDDDWNENVSTAVTRKPRGNANNFRHLRMDKVHYDAVTLVRQQPVVMSNWYHTSDDGELAEVEVTKAPKQPRNWARKQMDKLFALDKFCYRQDQQQQQQQQQQQVNKPKPKRPEPGHQRQPNGAILGERFEFSRSIKHKQQQQQNNKVRTIAYHEIKMGAVIGTGAFGKVFRGVWKQKQVAVKVLLCQRFTAAIRSEFEAELEIMSLLNHPNICQLVGACLLPPHRALVMEYLPLGSLWGVLRLEHNQLVLSRELRHDFVLDTAKGMQYLHQFARPILHRDLKTPNLLVDRDFRIKIADFGLARVKEHVKTMTGNCGTVQWMAPEVLANQKYTEKADVYSFGIVLWEIYSGQCPYEGMNQIQAAMAVLNHQLRPQVPKMWPFLYRSLMVKCWDHNPEKRPSFDRIVQVLESLDVDLLMKP